MLNQMKSEYEKKLKILENLKEEHRCNRFQSEYLEQAEKTSQIRQAKFNSTTSQTMLQHQRSFQTFSLSPTNPMKSFQPFLSLRVSTTGADVEDLSLKMQELYEKIEKIFI